MVTRGYEMNQRASAFFAEMIHSMTPEITELQSYRNKQTDRTTLRSAVRKSPESHNNTSEEQ